MQALVDYVRSLRAPHGSVVVTLTQADGTIRTVHGVADDKGTATVVVPAVPRGATKVMAQIDADGAVGCTLDVAVTDDVTVPCG